MHRLTVEHTFCAAHAITIRGEREPLHGHNWHITLTIESDSLDDDGLVCDFHDVDRSLHEITEPFNNRSLNDITPFDTLNPTAENVAKHFAEAMRITLPRGVRVVSCSTTEAPGCTATYLPDN